MQSYKLTLKNDRIGRYHSLGWLFTLIALVAATWVALSGITIDIPGLVGTGVSTVVALWLYRSFTITRKFAFQFPLLLLALPWLLLQYFWVAGVVALVALLHGFSIRPPIATIAQQGIQYPSFPAKDIQWNELNNVVLKDELLTIDFKSNKLIQQMIEQTAGTVHEQEFNDFCKKQLLKVAPERAV